MVDMDKGHFGEATTGNKFNISGGEPSRHRGQKRTLCPACMDQYLEEFAKIL